MAKGDNLHNKIKNSFEQKQNAPDLWSGISSKLEEESSPVLDQKVKASFTEQNHKAPEKIWSGVNKQLTIDKGWNKIQKYLVRMTFFRKLKRAAVFLFLLLLFWTKLPVLKSVLHENLHFTDEKELSFQNNDRNFIDAAEEQEKTNKESIDNSGIKEKDQVNKSTASNLVFNFDTVVSQEDSKSLTQESIRNHTSSDRIVSKSSSKTSEFLPELQELENKPSHLIENTFVKDLLSFDQIDVQDEDLTENTKPFEVGVIAALNESLLINNELRMALNPQSLVAFKPLPGSQLGAIFGYRFNKKFSLKGMFIHAHFQQSVEKYQSGKLINEKSDFRFVRLQTLGQYNHQLKNPNTSIAFKLGPYLSYLYNYQVALNQVKVDLSQDLLNSFDAGLTTHLGIEHHLQNKWVLDYGVNASKGLLNLNNSTLKKPASFNPVRSFELGLYISFRYKF